MRLILDAGALIALERDDALVKRLLRTENLARRPPLTHGGVVGQVWRGAGSRQTILARVMNGLEIRALDAGLGRSAGALLAQTRTSDVIDAALVLLAENGDWILTSDPDDIARLVEAAGLHVDVIAV